MKNNFCLLIAGLLLMCSGYSQVVLKNLRCENRINPIGIDIQKPRFSWQLVSNQRGVEQTTYEIRVGYKSGKNDVWNSGKVTSGQSVFVPYSGNALQSGETYYWQVKISDNKGETSDWSEKAYWQMGLLQPTDWKAKWIESTSEADTVNGPALLFRKEFSSAKKISSATVFIAVHGMYNAFINGSKMGDGFLTPGWTSYNKRLQYQEYDVTKFIHSGSNVIGVNIGSGWYRTNLAWNNNRNIYGKKIGLLLQLEIRYSDGSTETIVSDGTWKTSDQGPIRSSEIYNGETYDARMEKTGWDEPGYNDQDWSKQLLKTIIRKPICVAQYNEPVRMHESFQPVQGIQNTKRRTG